MPRTRQTKNKQPAQISSNDLFYLAGLFESQLNLRGTATGGAIAISDKPDWPARMAETYGGGYKQFTSRAEKTYYGWYVPIKRRLELIVMLEQSGVCKAMGPTDWDGIKFKLERAVNSGHGDEGGI